MILLTLIRCLSMNWLFFFNWIGFYLDLFFFWWTTRPITSLTYLLNDWLWGVLHDCFFCQWKAYHLTGIMTNWLIGLTFDWLWPSIGLELTENWCLIEHIQGLSNGWLTGWLTSWLHNWLTDRPTDCLNDWQTLWLTNWLTD